MSHVTYAEEIHALRCDRASILRELEQVKAELRAHVEYIIGLQAERDELAAERDRLREQVRAA